MTKFSFFCGAMLMASVPAMAQEVVVDDFETYADTTALRAVWTITSGGANEVRSLGEDGGSSGDNYMFVQDEAWAFGTVATDIMSPTAGNYKLEFDYKNGYALEPMKSLTVKLLQDETEKLSFSIPATSQASWTAAETPVVALTGSPITIKIDASNGGNPPGQEGGQVQYDAAFDNFRLVELASVPPEVSVFPDDRIYLSGTETITATLEFGSGTYTQVEFDVNDDGTVEHTATAAPFVFEWNTLDHVPAETSRTLDTRTGQENTPIPVRITVTDSENNTGSVLEEYTVDNEHGGRESMIVNGDFSQWTDGTDFGSNVPVGWVEHVAPEHVTYGPGDSYSPEANPALRVQFAGPDGGDRYTLRTVGKQGRYRDLQTTWWGKGGYARLYYFTSEDDVTYVNSFQTAGEANSAIWVFVVEPVQPNNLGLTDTSYVALATHVVAFASAATTPVEHFWDDITWEGNLLPPATSDVSDWKLY